MNYAHFAEWTRGLERELIEQFGVPRISAERIAEAVRVDAVAAEARARQMDQLVFQFYEVGSATLAKRFGVTDRTIRNWRTEELRKRNAA